MEHATTLTWQFLLEEKIQQIAHKKHTPGVHASRLTGIYEGYVKSFIFLGGKLLGHDLQDSVPTNLLEVSYSPRNLQQYPLSI